jgi:hypothetical protein
MKVAGCRAGGAGMNLRPLAAAAFLALLWPAAAAEQPPTVDTVVIPSGAFYEESIYAPADGSAWHVEAVSQNGTGPFDLYIVRTTDLISAYPHGNFDAVLAHDNDTSVTFDFYPRSKIQSFTLIVDNLDNSRDHDAVPQGNITVLLTRTPPLRSSPEATAALQAGTTVCAALLGVAAVGVAIYLKRRPRADFAGEMDGTAPRMEVDIEVPPPPRGAWAREVPDADPPPEDAK